MIETLAGLIREAGHDLPPVQERSGTPIGSVLPGTGAYDALTFGAPTYTGRPVSPDSAMTYSAVWCCVNGISKGLASVNLLTYRNLSPDGLKRELATDDYRYRLLREQPNDEMSSMQWRQFMLRSLLLWGNSYNYLEWDGRKRLKAIWPMRPDWVMVQRNPRTGLLEYRYQPLYPLASRVPAGVYDPWQILHIVGITDDGVMGISPITSFRNAIALGQAQEESAGRFVAGGGTQKVALVAPPGAKVSDPEKTRNDWRKANAGMDKAGEVAILQGLDVKTFGIPPKDAQFLEGRSWQLSEVARMYDYPLGMLYDGLAKPETYASAEQYDIRLVKHTFRPWAAAIEGKLNITVLGSNDALTCEHDLFDLQRGDLQSQMEAFKSGVVGMVMKPNEARARMRLAPDPDPNADKLWRQAQMVPIDAEVATGKSPQSQPAPQE